MTDLSLAREGIGKLSLAILEKILKAKNVNVIKMTKIAVAKINWILLDEDEQKRVIKLLTCDQMEAILRIKNATMFRKRDLSGKTKAELILHMRDMNYKNNNRGRITQNMKTKAWANTYGELLKAKCYCCHDTELNATGGFQMGHIISVANEGLTILKNLIPICTSCNVSMSSTNMDVFMKNQRIKVPRELRTRIIELLEQAESDESTNESDESTDYDSIDEVESSDEEDEEDGEEQINILSTSLIPPIDIWFRTEMIKRETISIQKYCYLGHYNSVKRAVELNPRNKDKKGDTLKLAIAGAYYIMYFANQNSKWYEQNGHNTLKKDYEIAKLKLKNPKRIIPEIPKVVISKDPVITPSHSKSISLIQPLDLISFDDSAIRVDKNISILPHKDTPKSISAQIMTDTQENTKLLQELQAKVNALNDNFNKIIEKSTIDVFDDNSILNGPTDIQKLETKVDQMSILLEMKLNQILILLKQKL
jgi:5-methylcytosine-specific restriction endonuclease McrA